MRHSFEVMCEVYEVTKQWSIDNCEDFDDVCSSEDATCGYILLRNGACYIDTLIELKNLLKGIKVDVTTIECSEEKLEVWYTWYS